MIPYGRHSVEDDDVKIVSDALGSGRLTSGPLVEKFEGAIANYVGAKYVIAVSSGTAALHAAMNALDVGLGDEVIVPTMTFVATANSVLYQGATPVLVDVDPETLLIDIDRVEEAISDRTKAVVAVDYAGQPVDYDRLKGLTDCNNIKLISDSCHALGAKYKGRSVGSIADMSVFSFHPVKHITTGEGGAISTDNSIYNDRMKKFRNHGMDNDFKNREELNTWEYTIRTLGFNYRITDIQCALGINQLRKNGMWLEKRRAIARRYDEALSSIEGINPLVGSSDVEHAYHLYIIKLDDDIDRKKAFMWFREKGVGVNVHYIPIHMQPYYQRKLNVCKGMFPNSEYMYEKILTIPLYPHLTDDDQSYIVDLLGSLKRKCHI